MVFLERLRDQLRTMFRRRVDRRLPPPGEKARPGAWLVLGSVKMQVTREMSDDFWAWLVKVGWRETDLRRDRRRYHTALKSAFDRLMNASSRERNTVLKEILQFRRPRLGGPTRQ